MKHINYIFATILALIAVAFCGCSDDISLPTPAGEEEMFDGIVLRIPDPQGLAAATTRAQSNASQIDLLEKEGTINSLHLFAFSTGENGESIHLNLWGEDSIDLPVHNENGTYQNFDITETFKGKGGTWKFYVVANLEEYGVNIADIKSEEDLLNAELNFFKENGENKEYLLSQSKIEKEGGLPMACLASDMQFRTEGGALSTVAGGQFAIPSNGKAEIHADLTFLCSKVRYTIFFDKTVEPAQGVFGNLSFNLTEVDAENVFAKGTTVGSDKTTEGDKATVSIKKNMLNACDYPDNAADYPEAGEEFKPLRDLEGNADFSKRAWQGVAYLPENSSASKRTTLKFLANAVKENGEKGSDLKFTMPLLPAENDNFIKRGYAYDIVAKVTKVDELEVINFDVQPWNAISLQYALTLPAYLHVDKTEIAVKAGERTSIWYESNADIEFESPKYGDVDIYTITKTEDQIVVRVNPNLPVDKFQEITDDKEGKYNYFHILAGNLRKKIDITKLELNTFLSVDPINFTIDVREQVGSGKYDGEYLITVETNLESFTIKDMNWITAKPARGENLKIYVNDGDEWKEVDLSNENSFKPVGGQRIFRVVYTGLNDGAPLWTASQDLKFSVSAEGVESHTVTTYIRPSLDKYIIHFRDNEGWQDAHIYVYQCLEIPATWNKTATTYDGQTYNLASMAVGYEDGNDARAALEYSFTGAVVFKGWSSPANSKTLLENRNGKYREGFWMFEDGYYHDGWNTDSWNPSKDNPDRYERGEAVDFCKEYRQSVACTYCKDVSDNPSWPGIRMEREDNGWWRFELTGVATPGKTLIMFTEGHDYTDEWQKRYPAENKVGVPLFDYPSHEGWIELKKNSDGSLRDDIAFVSQNPDGNTTTDPDPVDPDPTPKEKCKLYVENETGWGDNLHVYGHGAAQVFGGWPGAAASGTETINGVTYSIFEFDKTEGDVNLIFSNDGNNQTQYDGPTIYANRDYYIHAGGKDNTYMMHKLFIENNTGWDPLFVYAYADGKPELFGGWPGAKAEKIGNSNSYFVFFPETGDGYNIIINDNNGKQLSDKWFDSWRFQDDINIGANSETYFKAPKRKRSRK